MRGIMAKIQNVLISFGTFWLSLWVSAFLSRAFSRFTDGITYTDSILGAVKMGLISSSGVILAAIVAGVLVTIAVNGRQYYFWAGIIALLYVVNGPVRYHWSFPAATWDKNWQIVALIFPAIACIAAAALTSRYKNRLIHAKSSS
jgi:hypothetical protein